MLVIADNEWGCWHVYKGDKMRKILGLDIETTGLDAKKHGIIEGLSFHLSHYESVEKQDKKEKEKDES